MNRIISDTPKPVKIWTNELEQEAETQVRNLAALPFIHSHVAVMPDAHAGKGSTVGTVIATDGAIIPAAVGVDIGCGMCAVKLPFNAEALPSNLTKLRASIERSIPTGFNSNNSITDRVGNTLQTLTDKHNKIPTQNQAKQLGSLGGGNHFIELCIATDNSVWVVLHSGSRNLGKTLAEGHIDKAKNIMKQYFINLPDPDLAYLAQGTPEFKAYLDDLMFAQDFAKENRNEMMLRVLKDISYFMYGEDKGPDFMTTMRVDCHHNYTSRENHKGKNIWVTRKGVVS